MKKLIANIICGFVPKKEWRRKLRAQLTRDRFAELEEKIETVNSNVNFVKNEIADSARDIAEIVQPKSLPKSSSPDRKEEDFVLRGGLLEHGGIDWMSYLLSHDMATAVSMLRSGLDEQSLAWLDLTFRRIAIFPKDSKKNNYKIRLAHLESLCTTEELECMKFFEKELPKYREEFWVPKDQHFDIATFFFHSGLRSKSDKMKQYISGKDFIDGGAYIGDTALVFLRYYNPRRVYSFEISEKNCTAYESVMQKNNVMPDRYKLIQCGLSDKQCEIFINDSGRSGTSILSTGNDRVLLTDLDSFAQNNSLNIGFIKADVEGSILQCLQGMEKTIQRDRPVCCLSIYHNPAEFFEAKPLLDKITESLNYSITLEQHRPFQVLPLREIVLFAYPREL